MTFAQRYSDVDFMLACSSFEPFILFQNEEGKWNGKRGDFYLHSKKSITKEIEQWNKRLDLETIDTLCIYGIGLGYAFEAVRDWLDGQQDRLVVFIEDDLSVLHAFLQMPWAEIVVAHPRCHLHFVPDKKQWRTSVCNLMLQLPTEQIEVAALSSYRTLYPRKIKEMRLALFRQATTHYSLVMEALFSHKLFENLYPNFQRLSKASYINKLEGEFKDVPAVICGAGPSLAAAIPCLKQLDNRALIMAGGSSIAALNKHHIFPHLNLAIDPNPEELHRLRQASSFETPLLYGSRVLPSVFHTSNGPSGYIRTRTGGRVEEWLEEKLGLTETPIGPDLGLEAMSVTTLAIALAVRLGCNPIIFAGIDLAYTHMHRYADGVLAENQIQAAEIKKEKRASMRLIQRKDRHHQPLFTLVKWVMEASCISAYAKRHPHHQFLNATDGGIGFQGIPYQPLDVLMHLHCQKQFDVRGKIHTLLEQSRICTENTSSHFQVLRDSLVRCKEIANQMLIELEKIKKGEASFPSGKQVVLEMDFEEELAFDAVLQSLGLAVTQMMHRRFLHTEESDTTRLERTFAIWNRYQTAIDAYLEILTQLAP